MSDEESRESDEGAETSTGPLAGERLAAARREKQISVAEIAKELHIDEYKVRALERNEFEMLGAPVFAKGHLRKYAQLVGVGVDDVLADYYSLNRSVGMPPLVGRARPSTREINLGRWLVVLLVVGVAAAAWWWFVERETLPPRVDEAESGRVSLPPPAEGGAPDTAGDDTTPATDGGESVPRAQSPAPPEQQPAAAGTAAPADAESTAPAPASAASGSVSLALGFSGDCWTEITDAAGERLFFGLGTEGRNVTVSGTPPLSVMFGNADNVTVEVNGSAYPIPGGSRRGRIARFSILAP